MSIVRVIKYEQGISKFGGQKNKFFESLIFFNEVTLNVSISKIYDILEKNLLIDAKM